MKRLFSLLVMIAIFASLVLPGIYFYYSKDLPDLSTAREVSIALGRRIEAERMANATAGSQLKIIKFEVLPRSKLPRGIVAGLLAAEGCPEFLQAPKEAFPERAKRVFARLASAGMGPAGPGRCQMRFADLISETVGAADLIHLSIADSHVLEALTPEELLTFRLASTYYAQGLIGLRDASIQLFGKEPVLLDIAESAELIMAESSFNDMLLCKNPSRLKLIRDDVIDRMEAFATIQAAEAKRARAKPLHCSQHP